MSQCFQCRSVAELASVISRLQTHLFCHYYLIVSQFSWLVCYFVLGFPQLTALTLNEAVDLTVSAADS